MNELHLEAKVIDAVNAINNNAVSPVVKIADDFYLLDTSESGRGTITWTRFSSTGVPLESYQCRYSNYHKILQLTHGPMPKSKYEEVVHTELPEEVEVVTIGQILAGFKD